MGSRQIFRWSAGRKNSSRSEVLKVITLENDFTPIELGIKQIIYKNKELPEMVFKQPFKHFLFISQDDLFVTNFFLKHLKQYLTNAQEGGVGLL